MGRELRSSKKDVASATGYSNGYTKLSEKRSIESIDTEDDVTQTPKRAKLRDRTDYTKWRLVDDHGRQTWEYLEDDKAAEAWPQSTATKWHLGMETVGTPKPQEAILEHIG
jgi:lanosterol synthase